MNTVTGTEGQNTPLATGAMVKPLWFSRLIKSPFVIPFLLFLLMMVDFTAFHGGRIDDALITARYAKNLADGYGLVYNPAEKVQGYTAPLHCLLLSLLYLLTGKTIDVPVIAVFISSLGLFLISITAWLFFKRESWPVDALWVGLILFLHPTFMIIHGMETTLQAGLALLATWLWMRRNAEWAMVVCGLATLTRPDTCLLAVLFILEGYISKRKLFIYEGFLYMGVVASWILFSWIYYGELLPQSLDAKTSPLWGEIDPWKNVIDAYDHGWGYYPFRILQPVLLIGLVAIIWKAIRERRLPGWWPFAAWAILLTPIYYLLLDIQFCFPWYQGAFIVTAALVAATGIRTLLNWLFAAMNTLESSTISQSGLPELSRIVSAILLLLAVVFVTAQAPDVFISYYRVPGCHRYAIYRPAADWLRENTPPEATVATEEIGVLGYYSERHIHDLARIVNRGYDFTNLQADYVVLGGRANRHIPQPVKRDYILVKSFTYTHIGRAFIFGKRAENASYP